jgi:hypothetical protein
LDAEEQRVNLCGGCGALIEWGEAACDDCNADPPPMWEDTGPLAACSHCGEDLYHSKGESPDCPLYHLTDQELWSMWEEDARARNTYDPR